MFWVFRPFVCHKCTMSFKFEIHLCHHNIKVYLNVFKQYEIRLWLKRVRIIFFLWFLNFMPFQLFMITDLLVLSPLRSHNFCLQLLLQISSHIHLSHLECLTHPCVSMLAWMVPHTHCLSWFASNTLPSDLLIHHNWGHLWNRDFKDIISQTFLNGQTIC